MYIINLTKRKKTKLAQIKEHEQKTCSIRILEEVLLELFYSKVMFEVEV